MKLSELVEQRNKLDRLLLVDYENTVHQHLNELFAEVNKEIVDPELSTLIKKTHQDVSENLVNLRTQFAQQRDIVDDLINRGKIEYIKASNKLYDESKHDSPEYIYRRSQQNNLFEIQSIREEFLGRFGLYANWQYPGMQIRPLWGNITDYIKSLDPLYLVDTNEELFSRVKNLFSKQYQRRLRYYTINEESERIFEQLPHDQFGFIIAVDYFNFKPFWLISKFLEEFFSLLRPGGVCMFTYNNCDLASGVRQAENRFNSFVPQKDLITIAKGYGFDIIKTVDLQQNISWIELKKPGELTTLRGGQALAEIRSFDT